MRAEKIKESYLKTGYFIDKGQFDCGKHIAFEMESDLSAMRYAEKQIREYLEWQEKQGNSRFGEAILKYAADYLKERIDLSK